MYLLSAKNVMCLSQWIITLCLWLYCILYQEVEGWDPINGFNPQHILVPVPSQELFLVELLTAIVYSVFLNIAINQFMMTNLKLKKWTLQSY